MRWVRRRNCSVGRTEEPAEDRLDNPGDLKEVPRSRDVDRVGHDLPKREKKRSGKETSHLRPGTESVYTPPPPGLG